MAGPPKPTKLPSSTIAASSSSTKTLNAPKIEKKRKPLNKKISFVETEIKIEIKIDRWRRRPPASAEHFRRLHHRRAKLRFRRTIPPSSSPLTLVASLFAPRTPPKPPRNRSPYPEERRRRSKINAFHRKRKHRSRCKP